MACFHIQPLSRLSVLAYTFTQFKMNGSGQSGLLVIGQPLGWLTESLKPFQIFCSHQKEHLAS